METLRALRDAGLSADVLLRWGGPLERDLQQAERQWYREPLRRVRVLLRRGSRTRSVAVRVESVAAFAVLFALRPRVLYLNTVLSACYARPAIRLGIPVVLHVHELEPLASDVLRRYGLLEDTAALQHVHFVSCSTAVAENLRATTSQSSVVIPSVPDPVRVRSLAATAQRSGSALVVGACGTPDPRKGVDLFEQLADEILEQRPEVLFRWLGGEGRRRNMTHSRVDFLPATDNPYPFLAGLDVFVLTSRVDPFPLVVLEAMVLGRPVVAFDVGGVAEQVGEAGIVVPAGDVRTMCREVGRLLEDEDLRQHLGAMAMRRAEEVYGVELFHRQVVSVVQKAATSRRPRGT